MHFDKADFYIVIATIIVIYAAGAWKNKLPSTGSVHDLVSMIDTKGGNILILGALALYFFHRTEEMYYAVMALVNANTIKSDNGVALNGLLFCNGAFSAVSGALLKVMSGTEPIPPGTTTVSTPSSPKTPSTITVQSPGKTTITTPPVVEQETNASATVSTSTP